MNQNRIAKVENTLDITAGHIPRNLAGETELTARISINQDQSQKSEFRLRIIFPPVLRTTTCTRESNCLLDPHFTESAGFIAFAKKKERRRTGAKFFPKDEFFLPFRVIYSSETNFFYEHRLNSAEMKSRKQVSCVFCPSSMADEICDLRK